jgi:hypothetical protein
MKWKLAEIIPIFSEDRDSFGRDSRAILGA